MPDVARTPYPSPEWAVASEFEQLPLVGVWESARRYWILVLLPIVVFVVLGAGYALARTPVYTAQARLQVGRLNISTPGAIAGFAEAAETLASSFSRTITADGVVNPLAKQFDTTPAGIRARLNATPVPDSPLVDVIATGSSAGAAVALANAASTQLSSFLVNFNQTDPDSVALLGQVRAADLRYQRALAKLQRAQHSGQGPLTAKQQQLAAAVDTAHLQVQTLESAYSSTVSSLAVSGLLEPLVTATSASSDRSSYLQIAVFVGLVAGIVVGLGLATLRANQVARRTLTAPSWAPE
jgi:capsular polysaccharide biosynthesis protein